MDWASQRLEQDILDTPQIYRNERSEFLYIDLRIKEVCEANLGKSLILLLSAVI